MLAVRMAVVNPYVAVSRKKEMIGAVPMSAGHGRPGRVKDAADRRQQLQLLKKREIERGFERLPGDHTMRRFGKDF